MSEEKHLQVKSKELNLISKALIVPEIAKAKIELAYDKANILGRIKMVEADIIVEYGLLHKTYKTD